MTASPKFPIFVIAFGLGVAVLYTVLEVMTWAGFTYFPASGRIALGTLPPSRDEGPAMYWYGWTVLALAGGLVIGILATVLPENLAKRISANLLWIVPLVAFVVLGYGLRNYFTR
jgi:hypothetical protein